MASKPQPEPDVDILHGNLIAEYEEEILRVNGENARLHARETSLIQENQQLIQDVKVEINKRVTATVKNDILEAYQRANGEIHANFNNNFKFIVDSKIDIENRYANERKEFQRRILDAEARIAELEGSDGLRDLESGVQHLFTSIDFDPNNGVAGGITGSSAAARPSEATEKNKHEDIAGDKTDSHGKADLFITTDNNEDDDDTGGVTLDPSEARDDRHALATRGIKMTSQNHKLFLHPPYPEWEALIEDCEDAQVLREEFKKLYKVQREQKLLVIDGCEHVAALRNECKNSRRWLETRFQKMNTVTGEDEDRKSRRPGRWVDG